MMFGGEPAPDQSANALKACLVYGTIGLFILFAWALFGGPV